MREFTCHINLDNMPQEAVSETLSSIAQAVNDLPPEVTVTSAVLDAAGLKVGSWKLGSKRKYNKKGQNPQ